MAEVVFIEPKNMEEAYSRRVELTEKRIKLQSDLGVKNRSNREGVRLSGLEYWEWRDRARYALKHTETQQVLLKEWMRKHRKKTSLLIDEGLEPLNPAIMEEAYSGLLIIAQKYESSLNGAEKLFIQIIEEEWLEATNG